MNIRRLLSAMLLAVFLFVHSESGRTQPQEGRIDEWKALEISLKGAKSIQPKNGFVPDEATAIKIGEATASAQFGGKVIAGEKPFRARLYGDFWIVKGTLHPPGVLGGTAVIKVNKSDGRIVFMMHQE
jgi:hypothetical protein